MSSVSSPSSPPYSGGSKVSFLASTAREGMIGLGAMGTAVVFFHGALAYKVDQQMKASASQPILARATAPKDRSMLVRVRNLYKGVGSTMLNAPLYSIIVMCESAAKRTLSEDGKRALTSKEKSTISFSSGFASAVPGTAIDMFLLEQRRTRQNREKSDSIPAIYRRLVKDKGLTTLFRGVVPNGIKEGLFGYFMLEVAPGIKIKISEQLPDTLGTLKPVVSTLFSGLLTGAVCVGVSQPFDGVKAAMQLDYMRTSYPSMWSAVEGLYVKGCGNTDKILADLEKHKGHWVEKASRIVPRSAVRRLGGMSRFYAGAVGRLIAVSIASPVIMAVTDKLNSLLPSKSS